MQSFKESVIKKIAYTFKLRIKIASSQNFVCEQKSSKSFSFSYFLLTRSHSALHSSQILRRATAIYIKMLNQWLAIHLCNKNVLSKSTAGIVITVTINKSITNFKQSENSGITKHTAVTTSNTTNAFHPPAGSLRRYFQTHFVYPLTPFARRKRTITTKMPNTSDDTSIRNYYNVALELVMKCGPLVREGYSNANADFKEKAAFFDLVTKYDKDIEDILVEGLSKAFPESKFIGEEAVAESGKMPELTDAPTWIIDPIDGTTNFIHRIPYWCISVGLAVNKELVVGIVYNPIANEMYSAWKGHGAYMNGQRIRVKNCTKMNHAVLAYEISLVHAPLVRDKNVKRLSKLAANSLGSRCIGSAALTLCYVARGSFDCYHVEDLQPWDIAGGAVILREAGGNLYHTKGGEFHIMKPNLIAAATPELAKVMVGLIEEADALTHFTFK
ncbi:PREDICTED: inositol monophosphatase 3-like [Rhagoletis zephyria]|uniref:inositol monophosphatase 3-like n=1 Tax=Rhagoletis zephyria TaxID=28612 RepID=UPI0008116813|nr:PREDICTED: inositol monophosphatase 3-like [Rhagoletis zephyria]